MIRLPDGRVVASDNLCSHNIAAVDRNTAAMMIYVLPQIDEAKKALEQTKGLEPI